MLGYFRHNFADYFRANIVAYFFMTLVFLIGIVIGALAIKTLPEQQKAELVGYLRIFFQGLSQNPGELTDSAGLFSSVVLNNVKTVALMWILGFTIIGIPFVAFIVFTRGFVIGFTVGFLVNEYIMKGVVFAIVSVLPHNFLAIPAILVTGVSATSFSLMLARRKSHPKTNLIYESIGYTLICLIMLAAMVGAGLLEVYVSPVFMKLVAGLLIKD